MIAAPGAAAAEISVESAKTPEPMDDEMTSAMRPMSPMPRFAGAPFGASVGVVGCDMVAPILPDGAAPCVGTAA